MLRATAVASLLLSTAAAQTPATPPAFEVASVRGSQPGGGGREGGRGIGRRESIQVAPGSLTMRNVSFRSCVRWAWNVVDYQVNGPDWIDRERFDIVAKSGGAEPEEQLRLMLQTLLADRFKLAVHRQTKELPAWVLTVAKGGPKFKESTEEGEGSIEPNLQRMQVAVQHAPVSQLVDMLGNLLRAPIVDETGLKGRYDIVIKIDKYIPDPSTPVDILSTVLTAIQQELGLKLDQRKMALDLVVVDRAEKVPAEN